MGGVKYVELVWWAGRLRVRARVRITVRVSLRDMFLWCR